MSLYEPKQLADCMRLLRKNTVPIAEDIPEARCDHRPRRSRENLPAESECCSHYHQNRDQSRLDIRSHEVSYAFLRESHTLSSEPGFHDLVKRGQYQ